MPRVMTHRSDIFKNNPLTARARVYATCEVCGNCDFHFVGVWMDGWLVGCVCVLNARQPRA